MESEKVRLGLERELEFAALETWVSSSIPPHPPSQESGVNSYLPAWPQCSLNSPSREAEYWLDVSALLVPREGTKSHSVRRLREQSERTPSQKKDDA